MDRASETRSRSMCHMGSSDRDPVLLGWTTEPRSSLGEKQDSQDVEKISQ